MLSSNVIDTALLLPESGAAQQHKTAILFVMSQRSAVVLNAAGEVCLQCTNVCCRFQVSQYKI